MKKVLAAALLCAVSAFATWDYFPIKDAGKGEAKVGVEYGMAGDANHFGINLGARFSVISGLEVALMLWEPGYVITSSAGKDVDGPTGLKQPTLGLRYWLPMGVGVALDVGIPVQAGDYESDDASLSFTPAVQYSTKLTNELELGAEVSFSIPLENGNKVTPEKELSIGLELDYSLGSITPLVGVDVAIQVAKKQFDGKDDLSPDTATGIAPYVGAIFGINDMLSADVIVTFGIGEDYYGKDMPITINANLSVNF